MGGHLLPALGLAGRRQGQGRHFHLRVSHLVTTEHVVFSLRLFPTPWVGAGGLALGTGGGHLEGLKPHA